VNRIVAVVGPTATGKSALGIALARAFDGEVLACDSTAVYRGIDIGTDKVPLAEQHGVPHHMIDMVEPTEVYSAARYATEAAAMARAVVARGRLPIVVGGTGFYYRALKPYARGSSAWPRAEALQPCTGGWRASIQPPLSGSSQTTACGSYVPSRYICSRASR
jgi:tRNA dimethylallyltransferase